MQEKMESIMFDTHPMWPILLLSHDHAAPDADVQEQRMLLFAHAVRHIWRVMIAA